MAPLISKASLKTANRRNKIKSASAIYHFLVLVHSFSKISSGIDRYESVICSNFAVTNFFRGLREVALPEK